MDEAGFNTAEEDESSTAPRAELDLDQFLPYRLSRLADSISQSLAEFYAKRYQINVAQWRVLAWLSHCDDLTAKKVCTYTNMDKARVSRAIQTLEDREIISRSPSLHDQRLHNLHLTEKGRELLSELIPEALDWEAEFVSPLSSSEYRDLFNMMRKLERQVDRMEQDVVA